MRTIRLLLHESDSTYNEAQKKYFFNLDDKMDYPIRMKIVKAHYANHSNSTHPLVVYVRSDNLSDLIKTKHTLRCKDVRHEEYENILCTLEETHHIGRFSLELQADRRVFELEPNRFLRTIDIQFTNNDVPLAKSATAAQVQASGTADDILAMGDDLIAFIDFGAGRVQDQSFTNVTQAGETVYYLRNRGNNTELMFTNSYGNGGQLANFGTEGALALTRQNSWESYLDSWPIAQNDVNSQFCIHTLIKLTSFGFTYIIDTGFIKLLVWNQQLAYIDANDQKVPVLNFTPMVPYLLTVRRKETGNTASFEWKLENLTDNSITEATSGSGLTQWPNANGFAWRIGHASTQFSHLQSAFIVHNTLNETWQAESQTYLRNYYDGTTAENSPSNTESTTTDSQWFIELDVTLRN